MKLETKNRFILDNIIKMLEEQGPSLWRKPWIFSEEGAARNGESGRCYSGLLNPLIIACSMMDRGFTDQRWLPKGAMGRMTAQINKGEKATWILRPVFASVDDKDTGEKKQVLINFSIMPIWNVEQLTIKDESKLFRLADIEKSNLTITATSGNAQKFATDVGAAVSYGGQRACFIPSTDRINVPAVESFKSEEGFCTTLGHELVHWVGGSKRKNEIKDARFGDSSYAYEELVAELGSVFLCAKLGWDYESLENHKNYLASWLKNIKERPEVLFEAAKMAQGRVNWLISATSTEKKEAA
jgi:antirestriction protein ArdC